MQAKLYKETNIGEGGFNSGRYTWGMYTVRKHSKRNSWVAVNDEQGVTCFEANTLKEVREWLGQKLEG